MKNSDKLPEDGHGQWENLARTHAQFARADYYSWRSIYRRWVAPGFDTKSILGIAVLVAVFVVYKLAV